MRILVFISGSGTNLQALIDACKTKILNAEIVAVLSNKKDAYGIIRAEENGIKTYYKPFISSKMNRNEYDEDLAKFINNEINFDLIVLAGWMHLLSSYFLNLISQPIINLHPALPGQFPGKDAIGDAFKAYKKGLIEETGVMVHYVIEEMDKGDAIEIEKVPIYKEDTEDVLRERVRYYEKFVLIRAITKIGNIELIYKGKVRDVYNIMGNKLAIVTTNRQSAFDKYLCDIPGKGTILTNISAWWFKKTRHIIDNHYIKHFQNVMIVKKCIPFKVEVVVRGYITGNTKTSLWTRYSMGDRIYCGHKFNDGLIKNQKLEKNIVTPTTKGDVSDELISGNDVIDMNLMTEEEWNKVEKIALELFEYGQKTAEEHGLILVDTKYEFGKDNEGNIILIDEIHTCDSSRYWLMSTYNTRFNNGLEPDKFDKDTIRDWVRNVCDPYKDNIPEIPKEIIMKVCMNYNVFYKMIIHSIDEIEVEYDIKKFIKVIYQFC